MLSSSQLVNEQRYLSRDWWEKLLFSHRHRHIHAFALQVGEAKAPECFLSQG